MKIIANYRKIILILILGGLPILKVFSDQTDQSAAAKEYLASLEQPIILRGDYLKAAEVAYRGDFLNHIQSRKSNTDLSVFLSKIENYDIHIERKEDDFVVIFGPTVRNNAPDIFGGGARYVIDSKSFEIKEKVYTK